MKMPAYTQRIHFKHHKAILEKKNQVRGLTPSNFRTYCKATVLKMAGSWHEHKDTGGTEQRAGQRPTLTQPLGCNKDTKITGGNDSLSQTNSTKLTKYPYSKK